MAEQAALDAVWDKMTPCRIDDMRIVELPSCDETVAALAAEGARYVTDSWLGECVQPTRTAPRFRIRRA